MSILVGPNLRAAIFGGRAAIHAAQRMAAYQEAVEMPLNVSGFVYPPAAGTSVEIEFEGCMVALPVKATLGDLLKVCPETNAALIYMRPKYAAQAAVEALDSPPVTLVSMITEGLPERDAHLLRARAREQGTHLNGPSSIGILSAGVGRFGEIGGSMSNIHTASLTQPGSFGVLTKSGGLANEIMWMCSHHGDGVSTAVGIGGDAFPFSGLAEYLKMFDQDEATSTVVMAGEVGGRLEELAAEWFATERTRVQVIALVAGHCQEFLPRGLQFGHAGAREGPERQGSARSKVEALRTAGVTVVDSFGELARAIAEVAPKASNLKQAKESS